MGRRVESPSSINTFKQCPRKYYYVYVKKLETLPSIHLIRGKIVHSVLEDFFKVDSGKLPDDNCDVLLHGLMMDFLKNKWLEAKAEFEELDMTEAQRLFYFEETKKMVEYWLDNFLKRLKKEDLTFKEAFKKWKPRTEEEFVSENYKVRGFIDAIHEFENEVIVMDYKTSKKDEITSGYKLQLAIYALLYNEKHGKLPTKAGIDFLRHGQRMIDVDEELLKLAQFEIEMIHASTDSNNILDYPKKESPLCKWHSGQCDFYDYCFSNKK